MISLEGTRHERVIGVLAAYLIGFTTAFIAFGVTDITPEIQIVQVPATANTASVVAATEAAPANVDTMLPTTVAVTPDGLEVVRGGVPTLVSAYSEEGGEDGIHHSIYEYELSPNAEALYFCEVPTADAEACKPFVMDLVADVVYPLEANGERIALPLGVASEITWVGGEVTAIGTVVVDPLPR